ncbi:MAG: NHLP bacteriocin system secretion protein [Brasilonema octagenarum HA4186-MV1]|jgi:NHLM bacteriocin system secretion protein|uniref:NHLP bacteriocin system secretion protein n=1 Tax=Brasilonema octagenarum UFV-OR1 TaxID=417115 RepID=A0ABX1M989_9CYAN|nr:NHLP bacteriocin system secretion protein [Brasilonema octagenarum]MBW4628626.1 NHLP bacteriocin system secretion protein [Brasilonema octagenarum HA4186-MV1]NMF63539.1 NHLP bacteriocin system secretion protein [Brasilonema octagenarum UFV-OR1]
MESPDTSSNVQMPVQQGGHHPESSTGVLDKNKPEIKPDQSESGLQKSNAVEKSGEIRLRLLPVGVLFIAFVLWGVFGKIPNRAEGRAGILIPRSSIAIQPREGGRVLALNIRPGDTVKIGQVLATMEFPELETELQDKRGRLADLKAQNNQIGSVQTNRSQLNSSAVAQKRQANLGQIESLRVQLASNQSQREAYLDHLKYLHSFKASTDERLSAYNALAKEGAVPRIGFQPYFFQFSQQEVANSVNQTQVALDRLKGEDENLRAQMQTLTAANEALTTEKRSIDLQDTVSDVTRYNAISDQQRDINTLQTRIRANSQVVSLYNGKVEEISVNSGEVVPPSGRIGRLAVDNPNAKVNVVALFKVGDAKQLAPGMEVEVIPDLYDRERYGGIVAKVIQVAQQPVTASELSNLVGSQDLAEKLLLGRDKDDRDKPQPINASVTKVILELQTDSHTPSGFKWTEGKGAPRAITDGTTADVNAVIEERSLLSYLTPAFRWITGVY